jgi:hypothetical protein
LKLAEGKDILDDSMHGGRKVGSWRLEKDIVVSGDMIAKNWVVETFWARLTFPLLQHTALH